MVMRNGREDAAAAPTAPGSDVRVAPTAAAADDTADARSIIAGFVSLGGGEMAARVLSFLAVAYLTRHLGPDGFGIVAFASAVCGYFALAVSAGFNDIGAREVARHAGAAASIAAGATVLRLGLAAGALGLTAGTALVLGREPAVKLVLVLTALTYFSLAADTSWVYKGLRRNRRVAGALVAGQALYLGLALLLVHGPEDVALVPIAQFLGELASAAILGVPLLAAGARPDLREGWRILRGSAFLTLTRLMRTLIVTFDVVLLGLMAAPADVGIYGAAYRFCFLLVAIIVALNTSYLPSFARAAAGAGIAGLAARAGELSLALALPTVVGGVILAPQLLAFLFGPDYVAGTAAFRLLLLSIGFLFLYGVVHNILLVLDRTRIEFAAMTGAAVLNIGLNLLLIPRFGLNGAAFATAVAEGSILAFGLVLASRLGVPLDLRSLPRTAAAAAIMGAGILFLGPRTAPPLAIAAGAALYAFVLVLMRAVPADLRPHLREARASLGRARRKRTQP